MARKITWNEPDSTLVTKVDIHSSTTLYGTYTQVELINATTKYARKYDGFKPEIVVSNEIELKNIYHPLLLKNKSKNQVIPLTINIDNIKK